MLEIHNDDKMYFVCVIYMAFGGFFL